jgi:hypothetical protein
MSILSGKVDLLLFLGHGVGVSRDLNHVVGVDASVQNFHIRSLCCLAHSPRLSFTATAISCSEPRYRSVV